MRGVKCQTKRPPIESRLEAVTIAARVPKGAEAVQCPYCGWWHVVGYGSALERPSTPRKRR